MPPLDTHAYREIHMHTERCTYNAHAPVSRSKALPDCGQTRQPSLSLPHSRGADMKGLGWGGDRRIQRLIHVHRVNSRPNTPPFSSYLFPAVQYTAPSSSATSRRARPSVPVPSQKNEKRGRRVRQTVRVLFFDLNRLDHMYRLVRTDGDEVTGRNLRRLEEGHPLLLPL